MESEPSIGLKVSWLARMLRTRFDARARAIGLTRSQWRMIATIRMIEGATQAQLAQRLEINSVTAGRIIDRLEAAGHVERRADPEDRRANRLYLGAGAAPVVDQLAVLGLEEQRITVRGFTMEEQRMLDGLLQRMIANLQDEGEPDSACGAADAEPED